MRRLIRGGGIEDLANASLLTIEKKAFEEVDHVTRLVMSELLATQSQKAIAVTQCPKCGREMNPKKAQHRSLRRRLAQQSLYISSNSQAWTCIDVSGGNLT